MKKVKDVFDNLAITGSELYSLYSTDSFDADDDEAIANAINHVDSLAEALAVMTDLALIKWGNLDIEVYAEIEKAKATLAAYRGDI